ncbi:MAG: hypothetical protein ACRCYQ_15135, partial [Nocardioides sp.]
MKEIERFVDDLEPGQAGPRLPVEVALAAYPELAGAYDQAVARRDGLDRAIADMEHRLATEPKYPVRGRNDLNPEFWLDNASERARRLLAGSGGDQGVAETADEVARAQDQAHQRFKQASDLLDGSSGLEGHSDLLGNAPLRDELERFRAENLKFVNDPQVGASLPYEYRLPVGKPEAGVPDPVVERLAQQVNRVIHERPLDVNLEHAHNREYVRDYAKDKLRAIEEIRKRPGYGELSQSSRDLVDSTERFYKRTLAEIGGWSAEPASPPISPEQ